MPSRPAENPRSRLRVTRGAVILAVLALVLGACGGSSSGTTEGSTTTAQATTTQASSPTTEAATTTTQASTDITVGADGKLAPLPDGFPDSPITLWAGFAVGSSDDLLNRAFVQVANKYSPVRIAANAYEAGNNFTLELVKNYLPTLPRADEGYQIYDSNFVGLAVRPYSTDSAKEYDWNTLTPLAGVSFKPFVYVVRNDSSYQTLQDVVNAPEAKTGEMRYCSGTPTSTTTIAGLVWMKEAGLTMTFVPNNGNTGGRATMTGGGCEFGVFSLYPGATDDFRVLATNYREADNKLPDVPTLEGLGYSTVGGSLQGYGTLDAVPETHKQWILALIKLVVADPQFTSLNPEGVSIGYRSSEDVLKAMRSDVDNFYPVLQELDMAVKPAPSS